MSINEWYLVDPQELGEPPYGAEDHDMDLHCKKYRRITPEMREQERIAERRRNRQFVEGDPVHNAQDRLLFLIPNRNLRIPFNWFHIDSDAEKFFTAVARGSDVSVHCLGKSNMGKTLCRFLDVVLKHRGLRMRKEEDPPRMSLQDRRNRHWQAVIEDSSLARDSSPGLVRHVALMLVGASLDFTKSEGIRTKSTDLNGKIDKLSEWLQENDPRDLNSFENSEPERQKLRKSNDQAGPRSSRRGLGNDPERGKPKFNSRKRKAMKDRPSSDTRQKRQFQPRPPLPPPRPNDRVELPERPRY